VVVPAVVKHQTGWLSTSAVPGVLPLLHTVLTSLLAVVALVFVWRRLAGALERPLDAAVLVAVATVLAAIALGGHLARQATAGSRRRDLAAKLVTSGLLLIVGGAVILRGQSGGATVVFWCLLLAEQCWEWMPVRALARPVARALAEPVAHDQPITPGAIEDGRSPARGEGRIEVRPTIVPAIAVADTTAPNEDVLQQLTLSRSESGCQRLSGWLRLPVAAGQRLGNVHVAFCPPFPTTPEIEVEQLAGPACRIKTAQLLPYGARLEIKLATAAAEAGSVLLRFSAET
jgi:hypothetical protein